MNKKHWFWGTWRVNAATAVIWTMTAILTRYSWYDSLQERSPVAALMLTFCHAGVILLNAAIAYSLYLKEKEEDEKNDEEDLTLQYEYLEEELSYKRPTFWNSWKFPALLSIVALVTLIINISYWAYNLTADVSQTVKSTHGSLVVVHMLIALLFTIIAVKKCTDEY